MRRGVTVCQTNALTSIYGKFMENIFLRHIVALPLWSSFIQFSLNFPTEIFVVEAFLEQNIIIIVIVAMHHSHQL